MSIVCNGEGSDWEIPVNRLNQNQYNLEPKIKFQIHEEVKNAIRSNNSNVVNQNIDIHQISILLHDLTCQREQGVNCFDLYDPSHLDLQEYEDKADKIYRLLGSKEDTIAFINKLMIVSPITLKFLVDVI